MSYQKRVLVTLVLLASLSVAGEAFGCSEHQGWRVSLWHMWPDSRMAEKVEHFEPGVTLAVGDSGIECTVSEKQIEPETLGLEHYEYVEASCLFAGGDGVESVASYSRQKQHDRVYEQFDKTEIELRPKGSDRSYRLVVQCLNRDW